MKNNRSIKFKTGMFTNRIFFYVDKNKYKGIDVPWFGLETHGTGRIGYYSLTSYNDKPYRFNELIKEYGFK